MKKRQNLTLKSFGAGEPENPSRKRLAEWILSEHKTCCDLLSYKIESQIKDQKKYVDFLCAGGEFYSRRIKESFIGIKSGFLTSEPDASLDFLTYDSERIKKISKNASFSFPPPSGLGIEDAYYKKRDDFIGGLCDVYKKIMRCQRDCGIKEHLLISDLFDSTELEELSKNRVLFFSLAGESKTLESVLEYQNFIAVKPSKLAGVYELMNEYEIKKIAVINGNNDDFEKCLEYFDPENIISGGFTNGFGEEFWKDLKENSFVMR